MLHVLNDKQVKLTAFFREREKKKKQKTTGGLVCLIAVAAGALLLGSDLGLESPFRCLERYQMASWREAAAGSCVSRPSVED